MIAIYLLWESSATAVELNLGEFAYTFNGDCFALKVRIDGLLRIRDVVCQNGLPETEHGGSGEVGLCPPAVPRDEVGEGQCLENAAQVSEVGYS